MSETNKKQLFQNELLNKHLRKQNNNYYNMDFHQINCMCVMRNAKWPKSPILIITLIFLQIPQMRLIS